MLSVDERQAARIREYEAGLGQVDMMLAQQQASAASDKRRAINREAEIVSARRELAKLRGVPPGTTFDVEETD